MCGINGAVSFSNEMPERAILDCLRDRMALRGPDAADGYYRHPVYLGHRRLSIIDLATGDQPMRSPDGKCVLVFNGEIYNFHSVRAKLEAEGVQFSTSSDTEVILMGCVFWGIEKCLQQLEGMFAFAIWDSVLSTLTVVRDRFGEKPVYYFHNKEGFYFASELKALTPLVDGKEIDMEALNMFFSLTYIPAPYTIYKGIKKLEAGSILRVRSNGDIRKASYYNLAEVNQSQEPYADYDLAKRELRSLVETSVEERMIADVPLGAFLSGGIDSSIICAIMAKKAKEPINTFSIGFKEKAYDESGRAALVAKHIGSNHSLHIVDHEDLLRAADDIVDYFNEPFGDSSALPSWMVAKKAREKVTVVLTGDCADELFGGYEKYLAPYYASKYNVLPRVLRDIASRTISIVPHTAVTNHFLRKAKKVIRNASQNPFDLHYNLMLMGFSDQERFSLLKTDKAIDIRPSIRKHYDEFVSQSSVEKGFYTDVKVVLEGDMLSKVDRMCMMNSLEGRVPYLDSRVVEAAFRMPSRFKIQGRNKKRILKDTFVDLLPKEVFSFGKKGFGVPLALWFRKELKMEIETVLSREKISSQGLFSYSEVSRLLREHMDGRENHSAKLWCLYVFQKWYSKNFPEA